MSKPVSARPSSKPLLLRRPMAACLCDCANKSQNEASAKSSMRAEKQTSQYLLVDVVSVTEQKEAVTDPMSQHCGGHERAALKKCDYIEHACRLLCDSEKKKALRIAVRVLSGRVACVLEQVTFLPTVRGEKIGIKSKDIKIYEARVKKKRARSHISIMSRSENRPGSALL